MLGYMIYSICISLKERSRKATVFGLLMINHWLELHVVTNEDCVLTEADGNDGLGFISHPTLIDDALTRGKVSPHPVSRGFIAGAENYVKFLLRQKYLFSFAQCPPVLIAECSTWNRTLTPEIMKFLLK